MDALLVFRLLRDFWTAAQLAVLLVFNPVLCVVVMFAAAWADVMKPKEE